MLEHWHLACLGPNDPQFLARLQHRASALGIGERLHILPPVAEHTICGFIAAADASLVLIENVSQSYEFSFPNKLLESLFAGLPVLVSDRVELARMVERHGCGLVTDERDPARLARDLAYLLAHRTRYAPTPEQIAALEAAYGAPAQRRKYTALFSSARHRPHP